MALALFNKLFEPNCFDKIFLMQINRKNLYYFTQDKENDDPADWILNAVNEGQFKLNTKNIHTTSVAPIDMESDEYKWLRDANKA